MCYKEQRGRKSASHIEGTRETKNQRILNLLQWIRELQITLWPHFMWVTCIVISPRRCFSRSFHQLGLYSRYASVVIWLPDVRSVMLMLTSSNRLMVSILIVYFIISFWVRYFRLKKKLLFVTSFVRAWHVFRIIRYHHIETYFEQSR